MKMELTRLGYNDAFEKLRIENELKGFEIGRVIAEHKERYIVKTAEGEFEAEITGNLRFSAQSRIDFPAVGDWVAIIGLDAENVIIHKILPRLSIISRQAVGHTGEIQIIASNIDYAFLIQAVDRDFSVNRLERYLTMCYTSRVKPIIILTKTDLLEDHGIAEISHSIKQRVKGVPLITISNKTQDGYEVLTEMIESGKTYCMLGSSGVGKSTLLNNLSGRSVMKTDTISQSSNRGKHITSHRELIVLDSGGILIDNPGMREVGISDTEGGLETTFDSIVSIGQHCKYKDCTHVSEEGCAVLQAIENGEIDQNSYENYMKMEREKAHFESSVAERRKKDKDFGKMVKQFKNIKKSNKD